MDTASAVFPEGQEERDAEDAVVGRAAGTEEAMGGDLHLLIFLDDKGKARGTLYEDEGDGFGHLSGAYRLTTFEALWTGRGLSLTTSVRGSRPATRGRLTVSVFGPGLDGKMAVPRDVPFGMTTTNHEILP